MSWHGQDPISQAQSKGLGSRLWRNVPMDELAALKADPVNVLVLIVFAFAVLDAPALVDVVWAVVPIRM